MGTVNDTEPIIRKVLLASGGAFKGAYQVPILKALWERGNYDAVLGTSVGSINLAMIAQDKAQVLENIWSDLNTEDPWFGVPNFLKPLWLKTVLPWGKRPEGLFSLDPVRDLLRRHVDPQSFRCIYGCGVVRRDHGEHVTIVHGGENTKTLHDHILASSAMCGIMEPVYRDGEALVDGGHRHVLPVIPEAWLRHVKEVDAVFCQVLRDDALPDPKTNAIGNLLWSIEMALQNTALEDFEDLKELADKGMKVRVWSPKESLGGMLDASSDTIERRIRIGKEDTDHPTVLHSTGRPE